MSYRSCRLTTVVTICLQITGLFSLKYPTRLLTPKNLFEGDLVIIIKGSTSVSIDSNLDTADTIHQESQISIAAVTYNKMLQPLCIREDFNMNSMISINEMILFEDEDLDPYSIDDPGVSLVNTVDDVLYTQRWVKR